MKNRYWAAFHRGWSSGVPWEWPQWVMFAILIVLVGSIVQPIGSAWERFLAALAIWLTIRFVMQRGGFRW